MEHAERDVDLQHIVAALSEARSADHLGSVRPLLADDAVLHLPTGPVAGAGAVGAVILSWLHTLEAVPEVDEVVASGDRLAVLARWGDRQGAVFLTFDASGRVAVITVA